MLAQKFLGGRGHNAPSPLSTLAYCKIFTKKICKKNCNKIFQIFCGGWEGGKMPPAPQHPLPS